MELHDLSDEERVFCEKVKEEAEFYLGIDPEMMSNAFLSMTLESFPIGSLEDFMEELEEYTGVEIEYTAQTSLGELTKAFVESEKVSENS